MTPTLAEDPKEQIVEKVVRRLSAVYFRQTDSDNYKESCVRAGADLMYDLVSEELKELQFRINSLEK